MFNIKDEFNTMALKRVSTVKHRSYQGNYDIILAN